MLILPTDVAVLEPQFDMGLSRWVEYDGRLDSYDPRIRTSLAPMIPYGGVVIDGGAFLGSHTTVYAEQVGRGGHVFAFEPAPKHVECLRHNTRLYPQVQVIPLALYSRTTTLWLVPNPMNAGATVVGSPEDEGAYEVQATSLDDFLWGDPRVTITDPLPRRVDYIKLDIEGLVLRALEGASRVLRLCRPLVVVEVGDNLRLFGDSTEDVIECMQTYRYVPEDLPQMNDGDVTQRDMLFRPEERVS